jgi:hypothetical protein
MGVRHDEQKVLLWTWRLGRERQSNPKHRDRQKSEWEPTETAHSTNRTLFSIHLCPVKAAQGLINGTSDVKVAAV